MSGRRDRRSVAGASANPGAGRDARLAEFCDELLEDARAAGISIAKIYSGPYHPKGRAKFKKDSVFRKPAPGMFKMAQQEFDLNLARCWSIGHTTVDVLAGQRAGVGTILVQTGAADQDGAFHVEPHHVARDVLTATRYIQEFEMALRC